MKITIQANLTPQEDDVVDQLDAAAFSEDDGADAFEWSSSTWHVLIWHDNGRLVSHVGILTRTIQCGERDAFVGGIGGVATHPEHQGKGYAGIALQHAGLFMRTSLKVDFALLVCRDELIPYYGKFGWQKFEGDLLVDQPSGKMTFTFNKPMLLAGTKPVPQCETIDLCGTPW